MSANGCEVSFWGEENVLGLDVVSAPHYECTNTHNCMLLKGGCYGM